ncbi:hypothetical protein FCR2A7T_19590 [Flavobacterium cauense R2A-7]|nr:hypothetical protein FCR2A7T_19590 [Flavobacterium cauense R2A-7]
MLNLKSGLPIKRKNNNGKASRISKISQQQSHVRQIFGLKNDSNRNLQKQNVIFDFHQI